MYLDIRVMEMKGMELKNSVSMDVQNTSSMMDEWNYLRACYLWPRVVKGMLNQRGDRNEINNRQTLLALRDFVGSRVSMDEVINDINAGMVDEILINHLDLLRDSVNCMGKDGKSYERYVTSIDISKAESYATRVVKEIMESSYP